MSRITNLDSLRGIAALMVVFNHFANNTPSIETMRWFNDYTPFYHLIGGRQAVLLFFVLSGFVLTLSLSGPKKLPYAVYVARRLCRIYLPYLAALVFATALYCLFAVPNLSGVVASTSWNSITLPSALVSHVFMTGLYDSTLINPPGWSLIYELRISLLIPLLMLFIIRLKFIGLLVAFVFGLVALTIFSHLEGLNERVLAQTFLGSGLLTIYYVQFFVVGIFLAVFFQPLSIFVQRLPAYAHTLIALFILFFPYRILQMQLAFAEIYFACAAAYIILCCSVLSAPAKILSLSPLRWLGRVSYSLYLVHMPILLAVLYTIEGLPQGFGGLLVWVGILVIIFIVAEIFHRYVEQPSVALGKSLSKKFDF